MGRPFLHQRLSANSKGEGMKEEKESSLPRTAQLKLITRNGSLSCCASGGAFYQLNMTEFRKRASVKMCYEFGIFILSSKSAADVPPP